MTNLQGHPTFSDQILFQRPKDHSSSQNHLQCGNSFAPAYTVTTYSYQSTYRKIQDAQSRYGSILQKVVRSRKQKVPPPLTTAQPYTQIYAINNALGHIFMLLEWLGRAVALTTAIGCALLAIKKHIQLGRGK